MIHAILFTGKEILKPALSVRMWAGIYPRPKFF